jgi:hypothetical protein
MPEDNLLKMPKLVDPCDIKAADLLKNEKFVNHLRSAVKEWADTAKPADVGWMYNQICYREARKRGAKQRPSPRP